MLTFQDQYCGAISRICNLYRLAKQTGNFDAMHDLDEADRLVRAAIGKMESSGIQADADCSHKPRYSGVSAH